MHRCCRAAASLLKAWCSIHRYPISFLSAEDSVTRLAELTAWAEAVSTLTGTGSSGCVVSFVVSDLSGSEALIAVYRVDRQRCHLPSWAIETLSVLTLSELATSTSTLMLSLPVVD